MAIPPSNPDPGDQSPESWDDLLAPLSEADEDFARDVEEELFASQLTEELKGSVENLPDFESRVMHKVAHHRGWLGAKGHRLLRHARVAASLAVVTAIALAFMTQSRNESFNAENAPLTSLSRSLESNAQQLITDIDQSLNAPRPALEAPLESSAAPVLSLRSRSDSASSNEFVDTLFASALLSLREEALPEPPSASPPSDTNTMADADSINAAIGDLMVFNNLEQTDLLRSQTLRDNRADIARLLNIDAKHVLVGQSEILIYDLEQGTLRPLDLRELVTIWHGLNPESWANAPIELRSMMEPAVNTAPSSEHDVIPDR
ncbi:MAG: hypothetical protein AAGB34_09535 [Planctomycetota bacterium]